MFDKQTLKRFLAPLIALALAACTTASIPGEAPNAPPPANAEAMAVAANPHAVNAAIQILHEGGNAVDAAIAAELVLGLVEPQSSGIGGGGFLMFYDGRSEAISAYDGRERAPAGVTPNMFLARNGQPLPFMDAQASGLSIGAPSLIAMLKMAHDEHGRLPWPRLFEPAMQLAEQGFEVSPRLARLIAGYGERGRLRADFAARSYFFDGQGAPRPVGYLLRNPQYALTLRAIVEQGPQALSEGPIADAIVAAAQANPRRGTLTLDDLRAVAPRRIEPVCAPYRVYRACTVSPPSSGNATLAILGLYQRARPTPGGAGNADDWSAFLWASRLAYADRDHYMADSAFVPVPTQELIAPAYLDERARQIDVAHAPTRVDAGMPAGQELYDRWGNANSEENGTSHVSIVDAWGNAVVLTSTVESGFGSQRMVGGFFLNNQLTDFAFEPTLNGRPVANAVEPGKAPRSSMSPLIVLDRNGELVLLNGSPGGSSIIAYVARTTIGVLDWGLTPQQSIDLSNAYARSSPVVIESARMPAGIADTLTARGWQFRDVSALEDSGTSMIRVTPNGLVGGVDPRREGIVGHITPQPAAALAP